MYFTQILLTSIPSTTTKQHQRQTSTHQTNKQIYKQMNELMNDILYRLSLHEKQNFHDVCSSTSITTVAFVFLPSFLSRPHSSSSRALRPRSHLAHPECSARLSLAQRLTRSSPNAHETHSQHGHRQSTFEQARAADLNQVCKSTEHTFDKHEHELER